VERLPLSFWLTHGPGDDDDEDDMEEENAKPTHGLPPTFWSQLRLEKLEEARFPVKLVTFGPSPHVSSSLQPP
jgi:hypothetical protein